MVCAPPPVAGTWRCDDDYKTIPAAVKIRRVFNPKRRRAAHFSSSSIRSETFVSIDFPLLSRHNS